MTEPTFRIREANSADAGALLDLKLHLDRETQFMMLEPGERLDSASDEAARLECASDRENSVVLVAEDDDSLVGYVEAEGGRFRRNGHSAHVVIGVRQAAAGHGLGTSLLRELSVWARLHGIHRLELTVMAHNERAIALYRRNGYEFEGERRHSLRVGGSYVDELTKANNYD